MLHLDLNHFGQNVITFSAKTEERKKEAYIVLVGPMKPPQVNTYISRRIYTFTLIGKINTGIGIHSELSSLVWREDN